MNKKTILRTAKLAALGVVVYNIGRLDGYAEGRKMGRMIGQLETLHSLAEQVKNRDVQG